MKEQVKSDIQARRSSRGHVGVKGEQGDKREKGEDQVSSNLRCGRNYIKCGRNYRNYRNYSSFSEGEEYVESFYLHEDKFLLEIRNSVAKENLREIQISEKEAALLAFFIQLKQVRRILEIGTFAGYSAACMAKAIALDLGICDAFDKANKEKSDFSKAVNACKSDEFVEKAVESKRDAAIGNVTKDSHTDVLQKEHSEIVNCGKGIMQIPKIAEISQSPKIVTIEKNRERYLLAKKNLSTLPDFLQFIECFHGDALQILQNLDEGEFDMVFIDGKKSEYCVYLKILLKKIKRGGLIIADNTLMFSELYGMIEGSAYNNFEGIAQYKIKAAREMEKFHSYITNPNLFTSILLPTYSGMTIAVKK